MQGPAEVAVADETDVRAAQQDRVVVAGREVSLAAVAEGPVLAADPAREVDGQAERELGDRLGVRGAAAEDVDAGPEARLVVDVGVEVALDVHDDAQGAVARSMRDGRQIGLADDRERPRQDRVELVLVSSRGRAARPRSRGTVAPAPRA